MAMELRVPALGESVREATLGAWKHVEGDEVSVDEPLVEVESEKATVEVPSPGAGRLVKILRKPGDTVKIGEVIAEIDTDATTAARPSGNGEEKTAAALSPAAAPPAAPVVAPAPIASPVNGAQSPTDGPGVKASPALRRLMAEQDLGPGDVQGSGPAGRILREDVLRA